MKVEKVTGIVLAGGQGKRMASHIHKQYLKIEDHPIIVYTLMTFSRCNEIDEIILVVPKGEVDYNKKIINTYDLKKISKIVEGGEERYHSVYNALEHIKDDPNHYVLIHDGVRPFTTEKSIRTLINEMKKNKASILGVPVKDTIKKVDASHQVTSSEDRKELYAIQTPQGFRADIIKKAYRAFIKQSKKNITDDAMVVEQYTNETVKVIQGEYSNIKITTPEDLIIGEAILNNLVKKQIK
ncbi:2-C-methyl-D-erythritol 4-phosphate cytidylyltransferase [Natranaerovirga hydrolytica]|uniref:2-C-methyl-D-erythritol 4-phosphate cytidylyltransferase n=1 Tax=Natranaerovirga hydrolytica TaxID=680378 RepID=UPI001FA9BD47|nr:2-C-methyl-D-erythritol 4-phosphate cytidylyltransferase [Natranaerovirga hydrolytica]